MTFARLIELALWGAAFDKDATNVEYQEIREFAHSERNAAYVELDGLFVNVAKVVRCADCKHRHFSNKFGFVCDLDTGDPYELGRNSHIDNWYCADGVQKE